MKKLIPALCMLLVAACLMGTSTYAWFSANENVTAEGMSVKAATSGGLSIGIFTKSATGPAAPADTAYGTSVTYNATTDWALLATGATVSPVSFDLNSASADWYTASAVNNESKDADGTTYKLLTETDGEAIGYYQKTKFAIKSMDQSNAKYTLSVRKITVSATPDEGNTTSALLNQSVRVMVVCGDTKLVFAPLKTGNGTDLVFVDALLKEDDANPDKVTGATLANYTAAQMRTGEEYTGANLTTALTTAPVTVDVYVYYDGEDAQCKTNNAYEIDTLSVKIEFASVKTAG